MTMIRPRSDVVYGICRGLPSARFANKKDFDWLLYQHLTNVGSTLIFTYVCIFISSNATNAMINSSTANYTLTRQTK